MPVAPIARTFVPQDRAARPIFVTVLLATVHSVQQFFQVGRVRVSPLALTKAAAGTVHSRDGYTTLLLSPLECRVQKQGGTGVSPVMGTK
ncbi:MAG: hypothetical protein L3K26_12840 [Candidatus Hydrogenedentes bacterium]|nr:hypothetical protein [Candidatus Hydrogenedentota bacterium]